MPSSFRKSSKEEPTCGFFLAILNLLLALDSQIQMILRGLLSLLDEAVQQNHLAVVDAEDHSGNALRDRAPHFPETIAKWSAYRQPNRPAQLDLHNVDADH